VVELLALKSSEIETLERYEWKFLFYRRPGGPPAFRKLPEQSTAETWPGPQVSVEEVRDRTIFVLYVMAIAPADFYRAEACAVGGIGAYSRS
jgi:hypothetical protein